MLFSAAIVLPLIHKVTAITYKEPTYGPEHDVRGFHIYILSFNPPNNTKTWLLLFPVLSVGEGHRRLDYNLTCELDLGRQKLPTPYSQECGFCLPFPLPGAAPRTQP